MRALRGELLLRAWEAGRVVPELRRPLALLAVALPERDPAELNAITLAERNVLLLALHELTFGPLLEAVAECPACGEQLEFSLPVAEALTLGKAAQARERLTWTEEVGRYAVRQVTTEDLDACLAAADPAQAEAILLERCLLAPDQARPQPGTVREKFEELHASTELGCVIDCPACGAAERLDVDIARFLWTELRRSATRLLGDVHTLASSYGWTEPEVLALSPQRRDAYLELVSA